MAAVAESVRVEIPYKPRILQRVIHDAMECHRWAVVVCHRRFGKTVCAINQLQKAALTLERDRPRFAYIAPTYTQGKAVAWDYMKEYARVIPGVEVNESELRIDYPNGGQVRIYGVDNADRLRGLYLDGVVMDEVGLMSGTVWPEVIRPTLSDRQGWALFMGTPNGRNHFYKLVQEAQIQPDWFFVSYRASDTKYVAEEELVSARAMMTPEQYAQEYECSFEASVRGAVYARELQEALERGRIGVVPHDPGLPVDTDWDLGHDDATAIWFTQSAPSGDIRVIRYYENNHQALPHYAGVLSECASNNGYVYDTHWFPHDMAVTELGPGKTRLFQMQSLLSRPAQRGGGACMVVPRAKLEDGIQNVRMLLPMCRFDSTLCAVGIDALRNYRWKEQTEDPTGQLLPVHDWASHSADAFRTLAQRHFVPSERQVTLHQSRAAARALVADAASNRHRAIGPSGETLEEAMARIARAQRQRPPDRDPADRPSRQVGPRPRGGA